VGVLLVDLLQTVALRHLGKVTLGVLLHIMACYLEAQAVAVLAVLAVLVALLIVVLVDLEQ
jgi:hypothetical protein